MLKRNKHGQEQPRKCLQSNLQLFPPFMGGFCFIFSHFFCGNMCSSVTRLTYCVESYKRSVRRGEPCRRALMLITRLESVAVPGCGSSVFCAMLIWPTERCQILSYVKAIHSSICRITSSAESTALAVEGGYSSTIQSLTLVSFVIGVVTVGVVVIDVATIVVFFHIINAAVAAVVPMAQADDALMPAAPALWAAANKLPAATLPIEACIPAAMEPAATPAAVNPTAHKAAGTRTGAATVAAVPTKRPVRIPMLE
eukprot:284819621_5